MKSINENFIKYLNSVVGGEKEKLITQESFSKMVGCTAVSMSRYLSKQREIPVDILFKMKKSLNISDDKFMSFYSEYSIGNSSEVVERFNHLTDESKEKLLDYMNYLEYSENRSKQKVFKK